MNKEPASGIGITITALMGAVWLILKASGVDITEDMKDGVEALIGVLITIPAVTGLLIRFLVTPTGKANAKIEQAYVSTPGQDAKPTL